MSTPDHPTASESAQEAALKAWRRKAAKGLLRALRVKQLDGLPEQISETHKGDG